MGKGGGTHKTRIRRTGSGRYRRSTATARKKAEQNLRRLNAALERRVAERTAALQEERDRFAALINSISDEIWFADAAGRFTLVNASGSREFKLAAKTATNVRELAGTLEVLRPDGTPRPLEEAPPLRALRGETVTRQEEIVRTPATGELRYRQANATPVRNSSGQILGSVSVVRDITQYKQAQAAVRQSEERYRALVEASSDVVYRMSADWKEMRHLVGREFIPNTKQPSRSWLQKYIHPEDQRRVRAAINRAIRAKSVFELEHRVRRVDGSLGWTFSRAIPMLDATGEIIEWFGMASDITSKKEAELVRARLATIVESSTDAISAMDLNGVITDWAPGAERLYGYSAAQAVGQPITLIVPPDKQGEVLLLVDKTRRGERITSFETERLSKDGHRIAVSLSLAPVRDAAGRIVGSAAISRDISERKRLERQLLEVGEREQQRIGHDLHDGLGQELHGLCYLARLLERELREELPGRAPEARRLAKVLGEAFQLTRAVAHGLQPVNAVPEGLMLTLRELARRTRDLYGVDCRFQCRQPVLIQHHSVATHLYRIAQEAVNNAMKHGHPTRVRIQLAAMPKGIILGVRDNGVGLRRKKGSATGMGLHIMQYRAEAIRGSLVVQRHPGGGTEVICTVASQALHAPEENQNASNTTS